MNIYRVTATIDVEAEDAADAVDRFDAEYRDPLTVVHFRATCGSFDTTLAIGESRNNSAPVVTHVADVVERRVEERTS